MEVNYFIRQILTYLKIHSYNPSYNLAFEEYILCHRFNGDYLLLWQNDNTIVVGQSQSTEAATNRVFMESHCINIVRQTTGSNVVYHDLGNLNFSFITDTGDDWEQLPLKCFTMLVVAMLRGLGLYAEAS
mgnify:CR=1 FL=1